MADLVLPEKCDRPAAEVLLPELLNMAGDGPIRIDASQVTQMGQAVLQVLVAARHGERGAEITASDALTQAAQMTGLTRELFDGDAA